MTTSLSNLVNLKDYDIVLTTSFEFKYGICGHLFELVDYFYAIKTYTTLNPCILLSDGTTKKELELAIHQKYENLTVPQVFECHSPKVIIAKNILIVDGSPRIKNAEIFADNIFLFRCSESDFSKFSKFNSKVFLLQDFEIYEDKPSCVNVVDYKKKILFSKYKTYNTSAQNTAMFYLTTVCRALSQSELVASINKHGFENNIVITDNPSLYNTNSVLQVPVEHIWEKFSTYIYTRVPRQIDCSSRFILECMHYNKNIIYDIDYYDKALEVRKKDGLNGTSLLPTDAFLTLLNEQIKHTTN